MNRGPVVEKECLIHRVRGKYQQVWMFIAFAGTFLLAVPAFAFPTPEAVWVVGGILLKPALVFFPLFMLVWRVLEWRFRLVHLRAFGNRRLAIAASVLCFFAVMDVMNRITFNEEPPAFSKTGRPLVNVPELQLDQFQDLIQEGWEDLQVIDLRSTSAFEAWHIQNSVNMPDAGDKELEAFLEKSSASTFLIICYGGERSRSVAGALRTQFENRPVYSVYKGVFQLKLKLPSNTPYIARNIPPELANAWVEYGLARHEPGGGLVVGTDGVFRPKVKDLAAPPAFVADFGALLRAKLGGPWIAWVSLLAFNALVFWTLVYLRKRSQLLGKPGVPWWLEIVLVSLLTALVSLPAMTFPLFYGTTAQEFAVFGQTDFSRLLIFYWILLGIPLTCHLHHTSSRKERRLMQRAAHQQAGICRPFRPRLAVNFGPIFAFMVVVYFSVQVNCTGLWSLLFSLWWLLLCEYMAESWMVRRAGSKATLSLGDCPALGEHPAYVAATMDWKYQGLDHVQVDAQTLSPITKGVNGLTYSILLERLYPGGSRQEGLRVLGERPLAAAKPKSRLFRVGRELYQATHPLLEGFRAGRLELWIRGRAYPILKRLWIRRAVYWLQRHLLVLMQKRIQQMQAAQSFEQKKKVLNHMIEDLEAHYAPYQETMVQLHKRERDCLTASARPLGAAWSQILLEGRYVCAPGCLVDYSEMDWRELELDLDTAQGLGGIGALHARASILVLCAHDIIGHLAHELDQVWGYGACVYELSRQEILDHTRVPWPGMKQALVARAQAEEPWKALEPQTLRWPVHPDASPVASPLEENALEILSPASSGACGPIHLGSLESMPAGSVVVLERIAANELPRLRDALAVYCTRGSALSHPMLVAREWGVPVFKVGAAEKERLEMQSEVCFEPDGSWREASQD